VATPDVTGAPTEEVSVALPPRRESVLARYSRRSKLMTVGFNLVGLVALSYLLVAFLSAGEPTKEAGHHAPKVFGLDEEATSPPSHTTAVAGGKRSTASNVSTSDEMNPQDDHNVVMADAPDPGLVESTPQGDLPRVSEDGRQPWQVYARPFNPSDKRPRLAILVADLGMSRAVTDAAVSRLPASVTLAFDVQSPVVGAWCGRARQNGHEILLSVPMEPFDFPRSDPGPHTLLTTLPNSTNLDKFNWALKQGAGYVGITTLTGSRFTTDSDKLSVVMDALHQRGLMVLDAHVAPHSAVTNLAHDMHVPVATVNEKIDENLSPEAIDAALQQLEQVARLNGRAVGVVAPLPIIIDHLQTWLKTLPQDGIALAPISAVVQ